MSRLTAKTELDYFKKVYVSEDELVQKLGRYEGIGSPEELAKVIRCKDCIQFRKYSFSDSGICLMQNSEVEPLYYCAKGKTKEAGA